MPITGDHHQGPSVVSDRVRAHHSQMAAAQDVAFHRPDIDQDVLVACQQSLREGHRDTIDQLRLFESRFAKEVGVEHTVALGSSTAGLTVALESIGLGRGDEVVVSVLAPPEAAAAIIHHGALPVFVDVASQTMNVNPELLTAAISDRTRAVITTQHAGLPDELDSISKIADVYRLSMVNYAAYAISASCRGRRVSEYGDVTCFGLHGGMEISTGRGGLICTNNRILANRCRLLSGDGGQPDDLTVFGNTIVTDKDILVAGYDCLLSATDAALGLAQLDRLPVAWTRRREIAASYTAAFACDARYECPDVPRDCRHAWQQYVLRLQRRKLDLSRLELLSLLSERGIRARPVGRPLNTYAFCRRVAGVSHDEFPVATWESQRAILLPIYSRMTDEQVQAVIQAVLN